MANKYALVIVIAFVVVFAIEQSQTRPEVASVCAHAHVFVC